MKSRRGLGVFLAGALAATAGFAQTVSLSDVNSSVGIDLTPGGPTMYSWTVDGVEHLGPGTLQYFYRIGPAGPEAPLNTIAGAGAPSWLAVDTNPFTDVGLDTVSALYSAAGLADVELKISLLGGAPGSGFGDVAHQLKITNTGNTPLDFHLFQYADFNLGGTPGDDGIVMLDDPWTGLPDQVQQTDFNWYLNEVVTPDASLGAVDCSPALLASLTDGAPTTLSGYQGPIFPGDVEYALQWDYVIPQGGSLIISKDILITPEPATLTLAFVGLAGVALLRRRRG